jgi:hypothetical protein
MLLAAVNVPFDEELSDTQIFVARIEAEIATQEFDILVLPSQPRRTTPDAGVSRPQMECSTRALIEWLLELSARKHALVVCGTFELAKKPFPYRTALAACEGRLIARHVRWPIIKAPRLLTPVSKYITLLHTPYFAQPAALLFEDDLSSPIPLMGVAGSCMSLVSCLPTDVRLLDRARSIAAEFGVFVVLSAYPDAQVSEGDRSRSVILSPSGHEISAPTQLSPLLLAQIPEIPAWTETWGRAVHIDKVRKETRSNDWAQIGRDPLNARGGFYVP